jgi:PAS domain S-box-containing protein
MQDQDKTKEQLIDELNEMRQRVAECEAVQKSLTESELRYRQIVDKVSGGIFVIQDGWINFANEKASEITGYSREDALASTAIEAFVHPDDQEMLAQYHARRLQGDESQYQYPFRFIRKDGTVGWVKMTSSLIMWEGKPAALCLMADITDRKRAEEALQSSEERFHNLFETANDGIFLSDGSTFIECNAKAVQMFGCVEKNDIVGHTPTEFSPDKQPDGSNSMEKTLKYIYAALDSDPQTFYWKHCRKDGSTFDAEISITAITLKGKTYLQGIVRDVSQRKHMEKALAESEKKYRLITETIHDCFWIATPDIDKMLYVSPAYETIWGRSCESLYKSPRSFVDAMHPDDRKRAVDTLDEHRSQMKPCTITYRIVRPDGSIHWIEDRSFPVLDENGNWYMNVGVASDITVRKRMEDELRQSETKLRLIAETNEDVFWMCTPDNMKMIYLSPSYEKVWGRTRQSVYDHPLSFIEALHPEDRERVSVLLEEHGDRHRDHEYRIVKPDGTVRWIHDRAFPVRDKNRNVEMMTGVARDITDRKLDQETLRESEEKFAKVFRFAPIPMTLSKADDGSFVDVNDTFCEVSGFSLAECIGRNSIDVGWLLPEERNRLIGEIQTCGSVRGMDLKAQTKNKKELELIYSGELVQTAGHRLLLSTAMDITERKQLEEKNLRLAAIVDSSDDAIIGKTLDGTITSWNNGAEKIYGYKEHEVVGKSITILAPHDREDEIQGFLEQIKAGQSVKRIETVRRKRDGDIIPVSLTISPIIDKEGDIIGASTICRDISDSVKVAQERQSLQEQLLQAQKMEAVGTLAGGIAHDFNNLLQIVLGYSEVMLLRKKEDEADYADLQQICQAGKRGADLVKSLMTFSRKIETKFVPVDLNQEITTVRNLLSNTIPKTININLNFKGNLESIKADPSQISQILMNLGVNARDAMPDGGTLTFEATNVQLDEEYCNSHHEAKPGSYVLLTVSDTGQGMNEDTLSHIFEPFFTTKETGKGTGLGLATVYGIVKQHGGHITCQSDPGLGTTFNIYFPAIEKEKDSETPTVEMPIPGGTETILLVDDEESLRILGTKFLNKYGYRVITASNGKEALETYRRMGDSISLIMLDLLMPVMDGEKCLEEILHINPNAKVVIASGASESGPASETRVAGATGFVQKPYNMNQLLTTIREVLDKDIT